MNDMTYEEFQEYIMKNTPQTLPTDYANADIRIDHIYKLGESYDALTVRKPGEEGSPALNVNQMYQAYQQGADLNSIMNRVADVYASYKNVGLSVNIADLSNYEMIKDKLFIRLSNADANREMLQGVPYMPVENLVITYHVAVSNPGDKELASFTVTNDLLKSYGITWEELHKQAMENSPRIMPPVLRTLHSALAEEMDMPAPNSYDSQMYILTNKLNINGAACLMYDHAMDEAAKVIGGDYIILPSSIHEVILLKDNGNQNYDQLKQMVRQINQMTVQPDEQLANTVYHYDAKAKKLESPEAYSARINQEQVQRSQSTTQSITYQKSDISVKHPIKMKF